MFAQVASAAPLCSSLLKARGVQVFIESETGGVKLENDIVVTGELHYSLGFVLKNLDLSRGIIREWKNKGFQVLSVAEGESGLVPYLAKQARVAVTGMDLWYDKRHILPMGRMGRRMEKYRRVNARHLVEGDAFDMPFANESFEVILSHLLFNNLEPNGRSMALMEVLRVLKVNGEARIFGVSQINFDNLMRFMEKHLPQEVDDFDYTPGARSKPGWGLLTYKKTRELDLSMLLNFN